MSARAARAVRPVVGPASIGVDAAPGARIGTARPEPASPFGGGQVVGRDLGPFELGSGARLASLRVAYRPDGPGPADAPQVLVIHALTGPADAAGDWWSPLI